MLCFFVLETVYYLADCVAPFKMSQSEDQTSRRPNRGANKSSPPFRLPVCSAKHKGGDDTVGTNEWR